MTDPKKLLIVAATEKEMTPFLRWNGMMPYVRHNLGNVSVVTAFTGVGPVAAVVSIGELIDKYAPDLVIQAGIAGCYENSGLAVGDSVVVDTERLADLGVFGPAGLKPVFPVDNELFNTDCFPAATVLRRVVANTVSAACSPYVNSAGVAVESMEGYSLFYACMRKKQKFTEIRTVSNIVSSDRTSWNFGLATENLARTLKECLDLLCGKTPKEPQAKNAKLHP